MSERDDLRCEDLLVLRRVLSAMCLMMGGSTWLVLTITGGSRVVLLLAFLAFALALGVFACDHRLSRLQGRDRRRARV